jgi:hypothetical protein
MNAFSFKVSRARFRLNGTQEPQASGNGLPRASAALMLARSRVGLSRLKHLSSPQVSYPIAQPPRPVSHRPASARVGLNSFVRWITPSSSALQMLGC